MKLCTRVLASGLVSYDYFQFPEIKITVKDSCFKVIFDFEAKSDPSTEQDAKTRVEKV